MQRFGKRLAYKGQDHAKIRAEQYGSRNGAALRKHSGDLVVQCLEVTGDCRAYGHCRRQVTARALPEDCPQDREAVWQGQRDRAAVSFDIAGPGVDVFCVPGFFRVNIGALGFHDRDSLQSALRRALDALKMSPKGL